MAFAYAYAWEAEAARLAELAAQAELHVAELHIAELPS